MIRLMHLIAIALLVGSAGYAYSIKYETIYYAEQVAKLKTRVQREKEAIAVMRAEWQYFNRPDRLQVLAKRHLDLQPLTVKQIAKLSDVPERQMKVDAIGRKLESLGLGEPTATPQTGSTSAASTPSAAR